MKRQITIDGAGRVVIPKAMRQKLGLKAGDALGIDLADDQIMLRPIYPEMRMVKKRGIWVIRGGPPMTLEQANKMIDDAREERDRMVWGDLD
jgi:AbrB family looped-hinge helix DNA binding protein